MVGIVSYGTYVPTYRVKIEEIAQSWGKDPKEVSGSLGLVEKSVPGIDEDAVTIAFEAAGQSLLTFQGTPSDIDALFVGSESHPYAVNPTSTIVGDLLNIGGHYLASDLEFACKAGTAGMQAIIGLIESKQVRYGMAIGADAAQSKPHDALEYTSAASGVSMVLGAQYVIAELIGMTSYSTDTPDFWRRDGIRYPSHAGRFTGEPAYFSHVTAAAQDLFTKTHVTPSDLDYCVFHMPNGKFPREVARRLGFSREQLAPSLTIDHIGNPYSASAMLGFAAVLDSAKPNETICMVSYGSGAGSDAFLWKTTPELTNVQKKRRDAKCRVLDQIKQKMYVTYTQYLKQTHKL